MKYIQWSKIAMLLCIITLTTINEFTGLYASIVPYAVGFIILQCIEMDLDKT